MINWWWIQPLTEGSARSSTFHYTHKTRTTNLVAAKSKVVQWHKTNMTVRLLGGSLARKLDRTGAPSWVVRVQMECTNILHHTEHGKPYPTAATLTLLTSSYCIFKHRETLRLRHPFFSRMAKNARRELKQFVRAVNIWFWCVQLFWWMILVLLDAQFAGNSDFHT